LAGVTRIVFLSPANTAVAPLVCSTSGSGSGVSNKGVFTGSNVGACAGVVRREEFLPARLHGSHSIAVFGDEHPRSHPLRILDGVEKPVEAVKVAQKQGVPG